MFDRTTPLLGTLRAIWTRGASEPADALRVPELAATLARMIDAVASASDRPRGPLARLHPALIDCLHSGCPYHRTISLTLEVVLAMDERRGPARAAAIFAPKVASELPWLTALAPEVLVYPTYEPASMRELVRARALPVYVLGLSLEERDLDGGQRTPAELFFHDLDHLRFMVREDLALLGHPVPDPYQVEDGVLTTHDAASGTHRGVFEHALPLLKQETRRWRAHAEESWRLSVRLDDLLGRLPPHLAPVAELLLFEICHEKSLPLVSRVLSRELVRDAHRDKILKKQREGFWGASAPVFAAHDLCAAGQALASIMTAHERCAHADE